MKQGHFAFIFKQIGPVLFIFNSSYTMLYLRFGYQSAKRHAHKFYKKIGEILCPALNNERIVFNNIGFNHLIRKIKLRSRREQKRRFALLNYAKDILTSNKVFIEYRQEERQLIINKQGNPVARAICIYYWTFYYETKNSRIKLVVRQLGQGQKHFYSIMSDKRKKTP